jgi:hypothetical protein
LPPCSITRLTAAACRSSSSSSVADRSFVPENRSMAAASRALSLVKSCDAASTAPGDITAARSAGPTFSSMNCRAPRLTATMLAGDT